MNYSTVIVAILSLIGTLVGSFAGNSKTQALIEYRLKMLEAKVDKHNQVIERTYQLEKNEAVFQEQLADLEEHVDDLSRRVNNG